MCLPIHGKKQYKRRLFKSRAFLFPKIKNWVCVCVCVCVCRAPLLGIIILRSHCNFVALKREDGAEILVGQMPPIPTFNFSTSKEKIKLTSSSC